MKYIVKKEDSGSSIKNILKKRVGISSRLFTRLKKHNKVTVNNKKRRLHEEVVEGDEIRVQFDYEENSFEREPYPLEILFEDDVLLIVSKDPYYVVHPTLGHPTGTLMNFAAEHLYQKNDLSKIRFVNRLDRDTSGVVIMAKNQFIHHQLSEAMKRKEVDKYYIALVEGEIQEEHILIDAPIDRESEDSIMRVVKPDGKASQSVIDVVERFKGYSLLKVQLLTGRTHQIRVHLKHIGYPIVGDELYNKTSSLIGRQFLHCQMMRFTHPLTGETIHLEAPIKEDMQKALETVRSRDDESVY
jgi:23S rRNA pseudouridine1911/1915/1917 synthase